ncbi:MAG: hypothetical protein WBL18_10480 [Methanothrix sp.]
MYGYKKRVQKKSGKGDQKANKMRVKRAGKDIKRGQKEAQKKSILKLAEGGNKRKREGSIRSAAPPPQGLSSHG